MVIIKTKIIPNTQDKRDNKPIDDDAATKYFKREFGRW